MYLSKISSQWKIDYFLHLFEVATIEMIVIVIFIVYSSLYKKDDKSLILIVLS